MSRFRIMTAWSAAAIVSLGLAAGLTMAGWAWAYVFYASYFFCVIMLMRSEGRSRS